MSTRISKAKKKTRKPNRIYDSPALTMLLFQGSKDGTSYIHLSNPEEFSV